MEFTKIQDGLNKSLELHYKEDDKDDNLVLYRQDHANGFGNYTEVLENEFLQGEQNLLTDIFAASWMGKTFTNTLYMPLLINDEQLDRAVAAGDPREYFDFEPRVCYYNGLKPGEWTFEGNPETLYPQMIFIKEASTLKDISLSFQNIREEDSALQGNDVGLKEGYSSLFENINFGRLVTVWLKIDAIDILNLDFRKLKLLNINGENKYFILNKIENYIPGAPQTTKVELIEWKPSRSVEQATD